ncbi:hypothetical protein EU545_04790 [Candidatus Thorarchaeota archaeon]|nr:MAG: hypothetical protein EU545_04790 [Candidatus Thorarchaeota archaeon]
MREKIFILLTLLALVVVPIGLTPGVNAQDGPTYSVAVSIAPLGGIVKRVGGGSVDVVVILPEGVEPHASQLPTEAVTAAQNADLLVFTGHFPWEESLAQQVEKPFLSLEQPDAIENYTDYGARLSPLPGDVELGDEHEEHEDEGNPHGYWLLPTNALAIGNATRVALSSLDGELSDFFESNFELFSADVAAFENLIETMNDDYQFMDLNAITVFPAEAYVAEAFGIETVAYLQEGDIQISGSDLLQVQDALRNGSVSLILGSDVARLQAAGEFALQLVEDYGGTLVWWRALFFEGLADYLAVMTYNLGALTSALDYRGGTGTNPAFLVLFAGLAGVFGLVAVLEGVVIYRREKGE